MWQATIGDCLTLITASVPGGFLRILLSCAMLLAPTALRAASQRVALGTNHTLAITPYGTVVATGNNSYGQLGNGEPAPKTTGNPALPTIVNLKAYSAVPVLGLTRIVAVAAGDTHSMALDADGIVWVWGRNNYGQLAKISTAGGLAFSNIPIRVANLPLPSGAKVVEISAGANHNLVRDSTGNIYGWGLNERAQLGLPKTAALFLSQPRLIPLLLNDIPVPAFSISAGGVHSLALTTQGVFAWGANTDGQTGNGEITTVTADVTVPTLIPSTSGNGLFTSVVCLK